MVGSCHIERTLRSVILSTVLILCAPSYADPALNPGRYLTQDGTLTIRISEKGETLFELLSVSSWNGHTCGPLDGRIRNQRATWPRAAEHGRSQPCVVDFTPVGEDIQVTSNGDACHESCGAAVTFEGTYLKLRPECADAVIARTRREFKDAYDHRDYAKARGILESKLDQCTQLLGRPELDAMRNDLAITQYHLHDLAGCRRTLEPLREDAAKSDEELQYPVFALDMLLPGIRAARTNLKLCSESRAPEESKTKSVTDLRSMPGQIKKHTTVAVLLPSELPREDGDTYSSVASDENGWSIRIESRPDCEGANACFVGYFSGKRGRQPRGTPVSLALAKGIAGFYYERTCGGSCSPAEIAWVYKNVLYTIAFETADSMHDEQRLIALANSAIVGGER